MTRAGVRGFNGRLMKVLREWNAGVGTRSAAGEVAVVSGFEITDNQCEWTRPGDGRHYVGLAPRMLRGLFQALGLVPTAVAAGQGRAEGGISANSAVHLHSRR